MAASFVLEDLNSRVTFKADADADGFVKHGMTGWSVNGVNHMYEQNFWFRLEGDARETPLASLPLTFSNAVDVNPNPGLDTLSLRYTKEGFFTVDVRYTLAGSVACCSDVAEQVTITNLSTAPLRMTFFEYTDFDLSSTIPDTLGARPNANLFLQEDSATLVVPCPGLGAACLYTAQTTVLPAPSRWEISSFPTLRNSLSDGAITDLSNATSPFGPGDIVWAAQWDLVIPERGAWSLSKDKLLTATPVPLPAPALLLVGALGGLGLLGRRKAA